MQGLMIVTNTAASFDALLQQIRACRICSAELPLGPRPVVRGTPDARILIIGQAPGTRVHASGIPWDDKSGERLRAWLNLTPEQFYDESRIAIMPMGFCYPGRDPKGGDLPPRAECALEWHDRLRRHFTDIQLTLLIGSYAQAHYLGNSVHRTMTETVFNWRSYLPAFMPTPHPSWRTTFWLKKNPWFEAKVLPELQNRVAGLI